MGDSSGNPPTNTTSSSIIDEADPFMDEFNKSLEEATVFTKASQHGATHASIKAASPNGHAATEGNHTTSLLNALSPPVSPKIPSAPPSVTNGKMAQFLKPSSDPTKAGKELIEDVKNGMAKTVLSSVDIKARGGKAAAAANQAAIQATSDLALSRPSAVKEAARGSSLGSPLDQDVPKKSDLVIPSAAAAAASSSSTVTKQPPVPVPEVAKPPAVALKPSAVPSGRVVPARSFGFVRKDAPPGKPPPSKPVAVVVTAPQTPVPGVTTIASSIPEPVAPEIKPPAQSDKPPTPQPTVTVDTPLVRPPPPPPNPVIQSILMDPSPPVDTTSSLPVAVTTVEQKKQPEDVPMEDVKQPTADPTLLPPPPPPPTIDAKMEDTNQQESEREEENPTPPLSPQRSIDKEDKKKDKKDKKEKKHKKKDKKEKRHHHHKKNEELKPARSPSPPPLPDKEEQKEDDEEEPARSPSPHPSEREDKVSIVELMANQSAKEDIKKHHKKNRSSSRSPPARHHHKHDSDKKDKKEKKHHKKHHKKYKKRHHSSSSSHHRKEEKKEEKGSGDDNDVKEKEKKKKKHHHHHQKPISLIDDEAEESGAEDEAEEGEESERTHASSEPGSDGAEDLGPDEPPEALVHAVSRKNVTNDSEESQYENDGFVVGDHRSESLSPDEDLIKDDSLPEDEHEAASTGDDDDEQHFDPKRGFAGTSMDMSNKYKRLKKRVPEDDDDALEMELAAEKPLQSKKHIPIPSPPPTPPPPPPQIDLTAEDNSGGSGSEKESKDANSEKKKKHHKHHRHHKKDKKKREKTDDNNSEVSTEGTERKHHSKKKSKKHHHEKKEEEEENIVITKKNPGSIADAFSPEDEKKLLKEGVLQRISAQQQHHILPVATGSNANEADMRLPGSPTTISGKAMESSVMIHMMNKIITAGAAYYLMKHSSIDPRDNTTNYLCNDFESWLNACKTGKCPSAAVEHASLFRTYFGYEPTYPISSSIKTLNGYALRILDKITVGKPYRALFEQALNPETTFQLKFDKQVFNNLNKLKLANSLHPSANQIDTKLTFENTRTKETGILMDGICRINFVTQLDTILFCLRPIATLRQMVIDYAKSQHYATLNEATNKFEPNFILKVVTGQTQASNFMSLNKAKIDSYKNSLIECLVIIEGLDHTLSNSTKK